MTQLTEADLRPGDEVIVPSYGGEDAARRLQKAGAVPVFADIDPSSFCLTAAEAEQLIGPRTVGVLAVHLFGHPADMVGLEELTERRGLSLWEEGRPLGRLPSAQMLRRRRHAAFLSARLRGVLPPEVRAGTEHAFDEYVVRVPGNGRPDRDAFRNALRARGIEAYVPIVTPAHRSREFRTGQWLPEAERAAEEGLALPLTDTVSQRQLQRIAAVCNSLGGLLREPAC